MTSCYETGHRFIHVHTPGLKACLLCIWGKFIIYQLSYEILGIIMKIWPFITPILAILFSTCCPNSNTLICKLDRVY